MSEDDKRKRREKIEREKALKQKQMDKGRIVKK